MTTKFGDAPKTDYEVARLFGDVADSLEDGQILTVRKTSIEGRAVAILEVDY